MTKTSMTTKEARSLWASNLRSDEYEQARGALRKGNAMCCLGVACDLYAKHVDQSAEWIEGSPTGTHKFMGRDTTLPLDVKRWLGLATDVGALTYDGARETGQIACKHKLPNYSYLALTGANDGGMGFEQIADLIEGGGVCLTVEAQREIVEST